MYFTFTFLFIFFALSGSSYYFIFYFVGFWYFKTLIYEALVSSFVFSFVTLLLKSPLSKFSSSWILWVFWTDFCAVTYAGLLLCQIQMLQWCDWVNCVMGSSPVQCSCQCACKGRDEAHDRARDAGIQYQAHGEMRKREMEDKKSERGRGDRMRKLTEGDGGSWVKLSSKSSQSRLIPISSSSRQESFFAWPCLRCVCVKKRWGQIIYDWRWPLSKHNLRARSHSCSHCCEIGGHTDEKRDGGSASNTLFFY